MDKDQFEVELDQSDPMYQLSDGSGSTVLAAQLYVCTVSTVMARTEFLQYPAYRSFV